MKVRGSTVALVVGAVLGLLTSCASNQTPPAQVLMTGNPEAIKGCHYLGQVSGSDPAWSKNGEGFTEAQSEIRSAASHLGADTVYVTSSLGAGGAYGGSSVQGDAYDCRRSAAPSPSPTPKPKS